jgi:hypothetical protein
LCKRNNKMCTQVGKKNKKTVKASQQKGIYSQLETGMSIYIGIDSLDYESVLIDQKTYGYYPCPHMWFIVRTVKNNEDKSPILVLQRHPYNISVNELFDDDAVHNKTVYLDQMNRLYWKMENDVDVKHYATIKKDTNVSDLISSPTDPTINDYYEYIVYYKEREMHKNVMYESISTGKNEHPLKTAEDSYSEWKNALFAGKLNMFVPTYYHFDVSAHVG